MMTDPFAIHFSIKDTSVSFVLSSTVTINILLRSFFSLPPNTHCPSTLRPRLYFLLPIFVSSISTSTPRPPICCDFFRTISSQTSLQKLDQSTIVAELTPTSCIMYCWGSPWVQKYVIWSISASVRCDFSNQDPALMDFTTSWHCPFTFAVQRHLQSRTFWRNMIWRRDWFCRQRKWWRRRRKCDVDSENVDVDAENVT